MTSPAPTVAPALLAPPVPTPFRLRVPDADIDDLRTRLARTRWPQSVADPVPVSYTHLTLPTNREV